MAEPFYGSIPEGAGWIVMNLKTDKPAELDGKPLTKLTFDDADEIARLLNAVSDLVLRAAVDDAEGTG